MMRYLIYFLLIVLTACSSGKEESRLNPIKEFTTSLFESNKTSLEPSKYIEWIENPENGLRIEKTIEDYNFTLQYKPLDYVTLSELRNTELSKQKFGDKKKEFEGMYYLSLRIKSRVSDNLLKSKTVDASEESERLQYFSFHMQEDLKLVLGSDTIPCSLFHYERVYSISAFSDFILGFEIPKSKDIASGDLTFIYNDQVLNLGTIKIKIDKDDLTSIPTLIL